MLTIILKDETKLLSLAEGFKHAKVDYYINDELIISNTCDFHPADLDLLKFCGEMIHDQKIRTLGKNHKMIINVIQMKGVENE